MGDGNGYKRDGKAWFWDHWVFWIVIASVAFASVAGYVVDVPRLVPGWALEQQLIYRIEFAGVLLLLAYGLLIVLRLAWHNETLSQIQLGPVGGEAPAEEAAADELIKLQGEIRSLTEETSGTLETLDERVDDLLQRVDGLERASTHRAPEVN